MVDDSLNPTLALRALDAAVTGVVIADMTRADAPITYVNPAFERMTGYTADEMLGRNCRLLQGPVADRQAAAQFKRALAAGEDCQITLRNYRADGSAFWNEVTLSPVRDSDGRMIECIGFQNDVTERRDAEGRVEYLAYHDALTGLSNRHAVQDALDLATGSSRLDGAALALLYMDLDGFKHVNDSFGHAAGDELLRQLAGRLEKLIRPGDLLARQGGDEFLFILDGLEREPGTVASDVARRVVAAVAKPFLIAGAQVEIGASVGVSLFPRDAGDAATLLRHADAAMYESKAKKGGRWSLFDASTASDPQLPIGPTGKQRAPEPLSIEDAALAAAFDELLSGDVLVSAYQPLVEMDSGEVYGYEALARGPEGSPFAQPDALFSYARRVDRLGELDWACRAAALSGALAAGLTAPLRLFVNMEPEALGVPCPPQYRAVWERAADLDVVVEVTERALTARPAELLNALESFRDRGWGIALDDLGADSRSLALLSLLRPDVVKLDLQLIQARPDPRIAEIVTAVSAYAERTGAIILAEGLETDAHRAAAHSIGASHGQGWSYGRPGPLPAQAPPALVAPRPVRRRARRIAGTTPFEVVAPKVRIRRATKPLLLEMSWHLERQALELGETAVLVAAFQTAERFTPASRRRYTRLASEIAFVAALGIGLDAEPAPGVRGATLADDDALTDEWSVAVIAPHFAGALVAVDLGDDGPDDERRFDFTVTYDRELVTDATLSLMRRVLPVG